jgi:hypothetical protein
MDDDFDPSRYTRAPKFDVPSAIALAIKLLAAVPKHSPAAVKKAAKALRNKVIVLQSVWKARDRVEKRLDARPIDVLADNAMSRLVGRIEDYAGLPAEKYPLAGRAGVILATLFANGVSFLKSDYASQWAETQKRIERIDEENFEADINAIAGPEFLAEVRRIHKLYGEAIGVTKPRNESPVPSLSVPLRDVGAAMTLYALQLVSVCVDEEASSEARAGAREALKPFDEFRAAAARREARNEGDAVTPDVDVPEVPA